jgi:hypothetical protein
MPQGELLRPALAGRLGPPPRARPLARNWAWPTPSGGAIANLHDLEPSRWLHLGRCHAARALSSAPGRPARAPAPPRGRPARLAASDRTASLRARPTQAIEAPGRGMGHAQRTRARLAGSYIELGADAHPRHYRAPPGSLARTSSATGASDDREDHVVAFDLLTYAGVRANLPDDVPFVHGGHRRPRPGDAHARRARDRRRRELRARSRTTASPFLDPACSRARTSWARSSSSRRPGARRRAVPPRVDVRGLRRPRARRRTSGSPRISLPPAHAVQRVERPPAITSSARTSRRSDCRRRQQLLEQLRPVPVPGKVIPLFVRTRSPTRSLPL